MDTRRIAPELPRALSCGTDGAPRGRAAAHGPPVGPLVPVRRRSSHPYGTGAAGTCSVKGRVRGSVVTRFARPAGRVRSTLAPGALLLALAACGSGLPTEAELAALPDLVEAGTPVAFTGVHVVPMDAPRVLRNHTVLVREGRIAALGPDGEVPIPAGATVLDGDGRYLMPGLADMHVHLARQENLLLYLANGVTTVRNMWGTPVAINAWRDAIAAGTLLGPRIYSASRGLDGTPPYWETTVVVDDPAAAAQAVAQEAALGFDFIKVYNNLTTPVYDAIVAAAAQEGLPVVGHVPRAVGLEHALTLGQHTTEHLVGYPVGLEGDALRSFAERHARTATWVSPTLIVRISFVDGADAAMLEARDEMRFVHPAERANWGPTPGAAPRALQREQSRQRGRLLRALKDAGVGILLGTDSWISYVIHGFSIHDELRLLVEDAGFTPFEALLAGTADAARSVGAQGDWGTVGEGLRADFILLRANPLEDVGHVAARSGVMAGGTWLSEAELRRRLEALAAAYASGTARPGID